MRCAAPDMREIYILGSQTWTFGSFPQIHLPPMPRRPSTASTFTSRRIFNTKDFAGRYPAPDPQDPFAPLWVLRDRQDGSSSQVSSIDSESPRSNFSFPISPPPGNDEGEKERKRAWHKLHRRSVGQKLAQPQEPEPPLRRPKSLPGQRRRRSLNTPEPPFIVHNNSPSVSGYDNLQ